MKICIGFNGNTYVDERCHPSKIKKPSTVYVRGFESYGTYILDDDTGKYLDFPYRPYGPNYLNSKGKEMYGSYSYKDIKGLCNQISYFLLSNTDKIRKDYLYHYLGCCGNMNPQDIEEIVDNAREITWRTFRSKVYKQDIERLCKELGYNSKLKIHKDPYVRFYRSKFTINRGYEGAECHMTCYFIDHSAIEHVFVPYLYAT